MEAKRIVMVVLVIVAGVVTHARADLILPYDGSINSANPAFSMTNTGSGMAVRGLATGTGPVKNYGGYFTTAGAYGRAVYGQHTPSGNYGRIGTTWEGMFAYSEEGPGVVGRSNTGRGVAGGATGTGDVTNYGGYFAAAGDSGTGVRGEATATGIVQNYGGYFTAAGEFGKGVYAKCTGPHSFGVYAEGTIGVYGESKYTGVEGNATETGNSANYGGYFQAAGDRGTGVIGIASSEATGDPDLPGQPEYCGGAFSAYGLCGIGVYATGGRFAAQFDGRVEVNGPIDVDGSIYQRGSELHADYVFKPGYELETIDEHSRFMWENRHLKAIPKGKVDGNGQEIVEVGAHRKGIVEELEKAHIYIEQLHNRIAILEEKLAKLEAGINTEQHRLNVDRQYTFTSKMD